MWSLLSAGAVRVLGFVFDNPLARLAGGAALVLGLVVAFALEQQHVGAAKLAAKQEKTNARIVERGGAAAARTVDSRVQGQRDPTTRDD